MRKNDILVRVEDIEVSVETMDAAVNTMRGEVGGTAKLAGEAFDAVMYWLRAERAKSLEKLAGGSLDSNGIEIPYNYISVVNMPSEPGAEPVERT